MVKYKKTIVSALIVILVLFLIGQCTKYLSRTEIVAPVYIGSLKPSECRQIGPCEEFVLSDDFSFTVWWGNSLDQLVLGVDNKNIPDGVSRVYAENIEVVVTDASKATSYVSKNVEIMGEGVKGYSGLYLTGAGIKLPTKITSDMIYNVKIDFKVMKGNDVKEYRFQGNFKEGILVAYYPVV